MQGLGEMIEQMPHPLRGELLVQRLKESALNRGRDHTSINQSGPTHICLFIR
jgi:hypothetical protein